LKLVPTKIRGCFQAEPQVLRDARGYFVNVFGLDDLREVDPSFAVVRACRSFTRLTGAIRGLHFQREPKAEDKLVQCLRGRIYDVCVDLRPGSPTYLEWAAVELSAEHQELMLIPRGCAHGFQTLEEDCLVEYFVTNHYAPEHESGLRWDDPALGIPWPLPCSMTSERDKAWPLLTR
jgi:dTDP-4-dehydrorhamnose 3,5-epimerase